jgi:AcrR family transcriptional regulator
MRSNRSHSVTRAVEALAPVLRAGKRRPGRPARGAANEVPVKDRMLSISTQLFAAKGYRAVSIRTIAKRSGVTLSSLYHHFGDKRGLYLSAHLSEFRRSSARLEAALRRGESPEEQLLSFATELCRVLSEPGPLFRLLARHWLEGDPDVIRSLARATVPVQFNTVVRAIRKISHRRDPRATTMAIYALIHGLVTLRPFEDSLVRRPAVARAPKRMAEFSLLSLLPEIDWPKVRTRLERQEIRAARGE